MQLGVAAAKVVCRLDIIYEPLSPISHVYNNFNVQQNLEYALFHIHAQIKSIVTLMSLLLRTAFKTT